MRRKRKEDSLIIIALESRWPVAAFLSGGCLLIGYVVLPGLFANNVYLKALISTFQPLALLGAGAFGLTAFVKWLAGQTKASQQRKSSEVSRPLPDKNRSEPGLSLQQDAPATQELAFVPAQEWSLELLQNIEWKRFEDLCQRFYEAKGIRSECTPLGPDGGIDIHLYQDDSGSATAIVQCKAWGDSFVGVKPIRELLGVMVHEKVGKAFFMTSGKYSDDAKAFAAPNRITLIDGAMFLAMLQRLPNELRCSLLAFATAGAYNVPTCPSCGTKMRLIPGKDSKRDFWGCSDFPRCRQKLGARRGANIATAVYQ